MAVAALASCTKETTVAVQESSPIAFDKVFVDNATKATDITGENLAEFSVYGTVKNTSGDQGLIFNDTEVSGTKATGYSYTNTQYWVPSATYTFAAIAPYDARHWEYTLKNTTDAYNGEISFDNYEAGANQDVVFSSYSRTTEPTITATQDKVAFTFKHVLSRVRFTFMNKIAETANITLKVSEVHITNAHKKGTLTVENGETKTWDPQNAELNVTFNTASTVLAADGSESTEHHYLIPADHTYTVTFKVTIYQAGVDLGTYDRTAAVNLNMAKGSSYDIVAKLTTDNALPNALKPIEFTVNSVDTWDNSWTNSVEATVPAQGN